MTAPVRQTTVLSTKGQVILPKAVRERLRWEPGVRLVVEETEGGVVIKREKPFPPTTIDEVFGILKYDGPPITIEEMDAGIAAEARRRHDRD